MTKYRQNLPQLNNRLFLTDGGTETTIIYHDGIDLPYFAVFDLLKSEKGTRVLHEYYSRHAAIARANGLGFILESPTWRASADWGPKAWLHAVSACRYQSSVHRFPRNTPQGIRNRPKSRCRSAAALARVATATIPAAS